MIEAATRGALSKNVLLEISQNSQESTCARVLKRRHRTPMEDGRLFLSWFVWQDFNSAVKTELVLKQFMVFNS